MADRAPWIALALAALLVLPALTRPGARAWAVASVATLALVVLLLGLPTMAGWPGSGVRRNWTGHLLAGLALLWVARSLVRHAGVSWREMGFTILQRPGSLGPALGVGALALLLNASSVCHSLLRVQDVPLQAWLFQATMPGLLEEALLRGVLLALLDRAFAARRRIFGVEMGWGGAVVTLVFVALHGFDAGTFTAVLPAALLYLWLRTRTDSLLMPIVLHNLWNLSVYAALFAK